jgi:hemolysin III
MLHHAFRDFRDLRHLDMLMAFYGVAMGCVFFWRGVTKSWVMSFSMTLVVPLVFRLFLSDTGGRIASASVVYVAMALALLLPVGIRCLMDGSRRVFYPLLASVFFAIGVFFRESDSLPSLEGSIGTHCLWHVFGALSVFAILGYAYALELEGGGFNVRKDNGGG